MKLLAFLMAFGCQLSAASKDYLYGVHLFNEGDYYRAITELERFRFFEPKSPDSESALRLVAISYLRGEKWGLAADRFAKLHGDFPKSGLAQEYRFFEAEALYEARALGRAKACYEALLAAGLKKELSEFAQLRLASMDLIEGKWEEAARRFKEGERPLWEKASLEGAKWKPHTPGLLLLSSALVPGSGQIYAGYTYDGLSAFTLVGSFAAWSAWMFSRGDQSGGWVTGILGGVFYLGNLQGAYNAGKRANREKPRARMKAILEEIGELSPPQPTVTAK